MLNKLGKVLAGVLLLIMIVGVSGCMEKKYTPEEIKNEMLTYLQKKYGEEFAPIALARRNWAYGYDQLRVYPKGRDKEKDFFYVWGTRMDDGTYSMSDGYFGLIIKDEYEAVMAGFVKEIYKDFKITTSFGDGVMPDRLNKGTKVSEIYRKGEYFSSDTTIFVKQSTAKGIDTKESLKKIAGKMVENKLAGKVDIYEVYDDKYEKINLDSLDFTYMAKNGYFVHESNRIGINPELKIYGYEVTE